jgi:CelD/BcsL family acetyltransferase involved in cellulose biosynthesis
MLATRRVTGLSGLLALEEDWRALHGGAQLYARFEWHRALARHWLEEAALSYLQVLDGDRTVAILPMIASRIRARPLGDLSALTLGLREELSDFPVAADVRIEDVFAAVHEALARWPEPWDALRWPRALASSNVVRLAALFDPGKSRVVPEETCNLLDTARAYGEVWGGWSKNLRLTLTRSHKRLAQSGGMRLTCNGAPMDGSGPPTGDAEASFEAFLELEASGWKAAAGSAIRMIPAQRAFLADLLASRGGDFSAEVILLWRGEKPVAGEFTVTVHGCQHLLKIGYDESEKRYAPGQVLMAAIVEAACARGVVRVNLVTDMPWHPPWNPIPEPAFEILVFRRRWHAGLHKATLALRRAAAAALPGWITRRLRARSDSAIQSP